jgi:hypothetical protein
MKSKNISNSKFKNPSILFELLVRQVTADTLAGLNESPALAIMKRYFSASTELGKELQLYRVFFENGRVLTEAKAIHFIDLVVEQRKTLNSHKLAQEKYNLIKEVKAKYPLKEFLSAKIPNYIIHASIYKTFSSESVKDKAIAIMNIREMATARFTLIEHLAGKQVKKESKKHETIILEEFREQSEDLRLLAYQYVIDKFNQKYTNLDDKQKALLREYINNVSGTPTLLEYVRTEVRPLRDKINALSKNSVDKVIGIKLHEVSQQLAKIGGGREVKDNEIAALMIAYQLVREIES